MSKKVKPVAKHVKMRLEDLKSPPIDWKDADKLYYQECPKALEIPREVTGTIIGIIKTNTLEGVDIKHIENELKKVTADHETFCKKYESDVAKYETIKKETKDEMDAIINMLQVAENANQWLIEYEQIVAQPCYALINYLESKLPENKETETVEPTLEEKTND